MILLNGFDLSMETTESVMHFFFLSIGKGVNINLLEVWLSRILALG